MREPASGTASRSSRLDRWTFDFTAQSVSRAAASGETCATITCPDGDHEFRTPMASRHEALTRIRLATSARITVPADVELPEEVRTGGEPGLRAWAMALLSRIIHLSGAVDAMSRSSAESIRGGADESCSAPSPDRVQEIATSAVAAATSIHRSAALVSGADAVAVETFMEDALSEAAAAYACGGEVRRRLCDALTFAGAGFDFPWELVRGEAESLAVLYNFAPFRDTGSTVASKRLRVFSETFDVISCSFLQHKKQDPTVESISRPYVASKEFLPLSPSWASWPAFRTFAERSARTADERIAAGARYRRLYTRAMWAPSLYAGIRIKSAHPELMWTAEFSDPLSLDVEGAARGGALPRDSFTERLITRWESDYGHLEPVDLTIFRFAELLVYAYADSIIFTNAHQREVMLSTIAQPTLRARAAGISTVAHHPTLDAGFYALETVEYPVDSDHVHLGYFGEFYTARGITEITDALRALPDAVRSRVRLHVFTNWIPESAGGVKPANFSRKQFDLLVRRTLDGVGVNGIEDRVIFNSSLPYLSFLAVSQAFDYLIVTDAQSGDGHAVNPYLPSKWSDYLGSQAQVWALTEHGSVLSGMDIDVRTPIGDSHAARSALWDMVVEKFGDRQPVGEQS